MTPPIRVVPSPRRRRCSRVRRWAPASSSARRRASASSAISGATTSRMRRPRRASWRGPNSAAWATNVSSARTSTSCETSRGSAASERSMTSAWATVTSPARRAAASTSHRRSSPTARARSARASSWRTRVCVASHSAASRAAACAARSSAVDMIRSRSSTSLDSARTSSRKASALSPVDMKTGLTSATDFRAASMEAAASRIEWDIGTSSRMRHDLSVVAPGGPGTRAITSPSRLASPLPESNLGGGINACAEPIRHVKTGQGRQAGSRPMKAIRRVCTSASSDTGTRAPYCPLARSTSFHRFARLSSSILLCRPTQRR